MLPEKQQSKGRIVACWRGTHPKKRAFSYLGVSDLGTFRRIVSLV